MGLDMRGRKLQGGLWEYVSAAANSSIFWVILIGLITVYATLIAPRLGARGRIGYEANNIFGIKLNNQHKKVTVKYSVDGKDIDDDIYVLQLRIKNLGNRDIQGDRILTPPRFVFPNSCKIHRPITEEIPMW